MGGGLPPVIGAGSTGVMGTTGATGTGVGVGSGTTTTGGCSTGSEGAGVGAAAAWPETDTLDGGVRRLPGAALKPKVTLPPAGMVAFQLTGRNSERCPLRVCVASHTPEGVEARSMASDQLLTGEVVVLTNLTLPVRPLPQSELTRNSTRTPLVVKSASGEPLDGGAVGKGVGAGAGVGVGAGVGETDEPTNETTMFPEVRPPGFPTNPKSTCPPGGIEEFHPEWVTVAVFPLCAVSLAFQTEEILEGMVMLTDQSLTDVVPVFCRTMAPVKPEPQSESTRVVATSAANALLQVSAAAKKAAAPRRVNVFIQGHQTPMTPGPHVRLDEAAGKLGESAATV